jgi:hypothetical protein
MSLADKNLKELTKMVFSQKFEVIDEPQKFKGKSGKTWNFDALVKNEEALYGIFIRDWKREISITQLRQLHKACVDTPDIQGGIMVCNIVTEFSRDYSNQFGIRLLSRGALISKLRLKNFSSGF